MKVMQCWDDSVENDVKLVEILKRHGAKATFNFILPPEGDVRRTVWAYNETYKVVGLSVDEQKALYKGFKVACHGGKPYTRMSDEEVRAELRAAKLAAKEIFGQEECGMAYPGGGVDERVEKLVAESGCLYGRTTKNVDGLLPLSDPFALPSHCHHASPEFWRKYEEVRALDGVFYFWGHSYEMMNDKALWDEFEAKIARISEDPKAEWIDVVDLFIEKKP